MALAFASFLALSGCANRERDELPARFPGTAFAVLDDVSLGMSADALRQARPNAKLSSYSGFSEQVDGAGFAYGFPTGTVWKEEFLGGAPLTWVTHSRGSDSLAEARLAWSNSVQDAIREMGQPARCETIDGRSPGARAVWEDGDAWLEIAVRAGFDRATGRMPDRILTTASTGDDPASLNTLVPVDCGRLLADTALRTS